jgi:hypothetical protein
MSSFHEELSLQLLSILLLGVRMLPKNQMHQYEGVG